MNEQRDRRAVRLADQDNVILTGLDAEVGTIVVDLVERIRWAATKKERCRNALKRLVKEGRVRTWSENGQRLYAREDG